MRNILACGLSLSLIGCGGGGGGDEPSPASFNVQQAFTTLFSTPVSFPNLSARDASGNTYTLETSFTPAEDFTLNGTAYKQSVQNSTVRRNGAVLPGERFPTRYLLAQSRIAAQIRYTRNQGFAPRLAIVSIYNNPVELPTAATVGAGGTYANAVTYPSQISETSTAGATPSGNATIRWSVEPDTASTAYACVSTVVEKDCLKVNPAGAILGARVTVNASGQTLVFQ